MNPDWHWFSLACILAFDGAQPVNAATLMRYAMFFGWSICDCYANETQCLHMYGCNPFTSIPAHSAVPVPFTRCCCCWHFVQCAWALQGNSCNCADVLFITMPQNLLPHAFRPYPPLPCGLPPPPLNQRSNSLSVLPPNEEITWSIQGKWKIINSLNFSFRF